MSLHLLRIDLHLINYTCVALCLSPTFFSLFQHLQHLHSNQVAPGERLPHSLRRIDLGFPYRSLVYSVTPRSRLNMYYDNECETCDREFGSQQAAIQHMNALDHWAPRYECDTCDREFFTQRSAEQHMDATGHREPLFECETCNRRFHTQMSADQHMDALDHYKRHYCHDCNRSFQDENALRMVCCLCTSHCLVCVLS